MTIILQYLFILSPATNQPFPLPLSLYQSPLPTSPFSYQTLQNGKYPIDFVTKPSQKFKSKFPTPNLPLIC